MKLSNADRKRLRGATDVAEARSHVRFATVIVRASDRYLSYPLVWAGLFALMAGAALALFKSGESLRLGILIEAIVFVLIALAFDWLPLRLFIVPRRVKRERARSLCHREFAARVLSAGDHREGVLFFVSLGERYVEILATRDIHARLGDVVWQNVVADFASAARTGDPILGVEAAVKNCAIHLEMHFPAKPSQA